VIRTVLAHGTALVRAALASLLAKEHDIKVVAEVAEATAVAPTVTDQQPDVAVVDLALLGNGGPGDLRRHLPDCAVLVLAEARRPGRLAALSRVGHGVGYLAIEAPPDRLAEAVRRLARGEPAIDPILRRAARRIGNPLTLRESTVLTVAAAGESVPEIALQLCLSTGTVRNHLSQAVAKTGARTRLEAIRTAERAGWI